MEKGWAESPPGLLQIHKSVLFIPVHQIVLNFHSYVHVFRSVIFTRRLACLPQIEGLAAYVRGGRSALTQTVALAQAHACTEDHRDTGSVTGISAATDSGAVGQQMLSDNR